MAGNIAVANAGAFQFSFNLTPQIKDFTASSKKSNIGQWYFEFENVEEFFPLLWERVAPHLVRGVIITDNQGAISN
jgi:hypothetical protein